uniref:Uncharacterized protein n=1 Tax=Setaria italica TaxID=4555 RepID=K3Y9F2_SETIT
MGGGDRRGQGRDLGAAGERDGIGRCRIREHGSDWSGAVSRREGCRKALPGSPARGRRHGSAGRLITTRADRWAPLPPRFALAPSVLRAAGGGAAGRVANMEGEGYASVSLAALEYIHVHKTARLVEAAVASGAIAGAAGLPRWSASPGFLPLPHPRLARTWGRGDPRPGGGAVRRGLAGGPPRPALGLPLHPAHLPSAGGGRAFREVNAGVGTGAAGAVGAVGGPSATSVPELLECPVCTCSMFPPIHQPRYQVDHGKHVQLSACACK